MKKQTKRWLAAVLSVVLFAISLYTDAGATARAADTGAAKVSIVNLPEEGVLMLDEESNYGRYDFDATKISGVLYWEVKKGTTTGVQSSYTGKVYPVKAGEFEIRVLVFRTRANRTKWLDARKANGYVADPAAEKYVKVASDWATITVKGEEGLAVAGTQSRLNKLLKDKNVEHIVISTEAERTFEIGNKNYKSKTLTVNAPNSEVDNQGRFAAINVAQIKDSTFRERAKGNRFHVTAPNARIIVEKGARVGAVSFLPDMKKAPDAKLNLEVNGTLSGLTIAPVNQEKGAKQAVVAVNTAENANVSDVKVEKAAILEIKGENTSKTKVTVEESAEGTVINAETPIAAELKASVELKLDKGAAESVLTLVKAITALIGGGVNGKAENVIIKMEKEAEGAKLETTAKVEIKTEARVEITLGEGAEGSTIVAALEVAEEIKIENQSKEEVVIKDETGKVSTTVGAGSDVQVTPVPTTAPGTGTTTPGTGTTTTPSTGTPIPTTVPGSEIKVGKVTYTLDRKKEAKEITLRVNENPDVNENNKADAYYVTDITVPQGTRIIEFMVEAKEPYGKKSIGRLFGFDPETGVVLGIENDIKFSFDIWNDPDEAERSHVEILVNISVGEDKVTSTGTQKPGTLDSVGYRDPDTQKEVEIAFELKEKGFIYEAQVPVPEGKSEVQVYATGTGYGTYSTTFNLNASSNRLVLYPEDLDKNTVLVVNLIAKKQGQEPKPVAGTLGTITYQVNGEGKSTTVTPAAAPDADGKCSVTVNIEKDDISTVNSLVFEIAGNDQYNAVTGASITLVEEGNSKTGNKTVTVTPKDATQYKELAVTFNVTVSKKSTTIPAYTGSVSYKVGNATEVSTNNPRETVNLGEGVTGQITITLPAGTDLTKYKISTVFKKEDYSESNGIIVAGETIIAEVTITARDATANKNIYTITFTAPSSQPDEGDGKEEKLTVTLSSTISEGNTSIVVTGSAVESEEDVTVEETESAPTTNPENIVEVTVAQGEATSTATATVKFKGDNSKDKFSAGSVKITFTATAKKGEETVTDNVTYTWKKGNEVLADKNQATCEVEIDLTELDTEGQTYSVTVTEKTEPETP